MPAAADAQAWSSAASARSPAVAQRTVRVPTLAERVGDPVVADGQPREAQRLASPRGMSPTAAATSTQ